VDGANGRAVDLIRAVMALVEHQCMVIFWKDIVKKTAIAWFHWVLQRTLEEVVYPVTINGENVF
jgi:hypothetical protein